MESCLTTFRPIASPSKTRVQRGADEGRSYWSADFTPSMDVDEEPSPKVIRRSSRRASD